MRDSTRGGRERVLGRAFWALSRPPPQRASGSSGVGLRHVPNALPFDEDDRSDRDEDDG